MVPDHCTATNILTSIYAIQHYNTVQGLNVWKTKINQFEATHPLVYADLYK
jgi:hypothetical protein